MAARDLQDQIHVEPVGDRAVIADHGAAGRLVKRRRLGGEIPDLGSIADRFRRPAFAHCRGEMRRGGDDAVRRVDQPLFLRDHQRRDVVEAGDVVEAVVHQRGSRQRGGDRIPAGKLHDSNRTPDVQDPPGLAQRGTQIGNLLRVGDALINVG